MPGAPDPHNADRTPQVSKPHGYVFEVASSAESLVEPVPIRAMGRFYHEAVAVDPLTGFCYLTEDRDDGLLYRYRPDVVTRARTRPTDIRPGDLAKGGVLEALRITGTPQARTQNWGDTPGVTVGQRLAVDWVAIPDVEPDCDMERDPDDHEHELLARRPRTSPTSIRAQGFRLGAAQFARMEGIAWHRRAIYACATNGGRARAGQVWRLDLDTNALTLALEPNDRALLEGPDNLAPMPNGDLVICEDGRDDDHVRGLTASGRLYPIARNAMNGSEMAGACFSPDGRTLFVNCQNPGITFAIWGPWEKRKA
jgi:secreted PhoX family phosphatase